MQSIFRTMNQICLIVLFPILLNAAEILYEKDWTRIITGDRATRLTREISDLPKPTSISQKPINNILDIMGFKSPNPSQLNAWLGGLQRYGWAQQENEPEHEFYRVLQIIVSGGQKPELLAKRYGPNGQTAKARFSLDGKKLSFDKIEVPEKLNRDVFYTVTSLPLFILNQEHFQKHFFEQMLDLDYPGFAAVKKAYENKKLLLAAHEVAEYFRRKQHPIWSNSTAINKVENIQTASARRESQLELETDRAADKVLRHEFQYGDSTIYLGERIDYRNNPTNYLEWIWNINRMNHWVTLMNGYEKTSNESYAIEFNRDVINWVVRNPAPSFRLTRVPSWRNLEAGDRMSITWPKSFFGFMASPSFQTQAVQLMLASIWSHAQHIERFPSGLTFSSNWSIVESNGLAAVGMYFPEFQNSEHWTNLGFQRLASQMDIQIYPDGVQHELAPGYHNYCLSSFYRAYDVARKIGLQIPQNYKNVLEKMTAYLMYIAAPSRQTPPSNDAHRFDIRSWMQTGADNFDRKDMLFIATNGEKGQPPELTSVQFPWAGQSVMRGGWGPDAWYLFFDAGPTGVNHQNEDKLHIGASAYGRLFLSDAGISNYIPNKWRRYFTSTQAHNTLIIDGKGQKRIPQKNTHRAASPLKNRWISNEQIDFASGTFKDGYGLDSIAVTHSRYVLFKKTDYWLVLDYITGEGEHDFESLFHLVPCEVKVNNDQKSIRTLFKDNKNIQLVSKATVPMKLDVIKGAENPEQGWMVVEHRKRAASPTAVFKGRGKLPILLATVIQPFAEKNATNIRIEIQSAIASQAHLVVKTDKGDDEWIVNLENENKVFVNKIEKVAAISFNRTFKSKTIESFTAGF
jgi:hypothetical protein